MNPTRIGKLLVTGSTGKLGREMARVFPECLKPIRQELDIVDKDHVFSYIKLHKPKTVIHLAALVGIRECEDDKQLAWDSNVGGTKNILEACEQFAPHCYFVYMSSPCVFSGNEGNYTEESLPHPKNFYGITKMVAEVLVLNSRLKTLVVRGNFSSKDTWPYPKAFIDRFGTYLFADDLAKAIKEAMGKDAEGILHIIGDRKMSMFELAKMTTAHVEPFTLAEYSGPPLTKDMSMDTIYPEWKKFKISKA